MCSLQPRIHTQQPEHLKQNSRAGGDFRATASAPLAHVKQLVWCLSAPSYH